MPKKRIRAAHAEKQQIRKTCNYPNRLNLTDLTDWGVRRSKYFQKFYIQTAEPKVTASNGRFLLLIMILILIFSPVRKVWGAGS
jgi:hypothetical protein